MFEQQYYQNEGAMPQQRQEVPRGDLFKHYEIRSWAPSSRLYKILAISFVGNVFGILAIAQFSLLTTKGCDSPFVSNVCQVLDTVLVASTLFGTDRDVVDVAYEKTDLGDAEITYLDMTGISPPLSYPEGYFQLANPETMFVENMTVDDTAGFGTDPSSGVTSGIPGIPSGIPYSQSPSSGGSLIDTKPNYPQPKESVVDGGLPSGFGSSSPNPTVPNRRVKRPRTPRPVNGGVNANSDVDPNETVAGTGNANTSASPQPSPSVEPILALDPNAVNNRPLVDLSRYVNDLMDRNQYKLDSQFVMQVRAKLNKEGKFDKSTFKIVRAESNEKVTIEVLRTAIEAINDSGRLKLLSDLAGKDLNLMLGQDQANLNAMIEAVMESPNRANSIKSILDLGIAAAKRSKEGSSDQNDIDDLLLLNSAKIETDGPRVFIKFSTPKDRLIPMIQRKLAEEKAKAARPAQPNGNAAAGAMDKTARK